MKGLANSEPGARGQDGDPMLVFIPGLGRRGGLGLLQLWAGAHPAHSHGTAGASPAWGAAEGCRWCPWHPPVSRGARALSCMSSCMCWASGMNIHGPTGTVISVSTGMRSSQVSPVVHKPGLAWESVERAAGVGQGLRSCLAIGKRRSISRPFACRPWGRRGAPSLWDLGSSPDAALCSVFKPSPTHPQSGGLGITSSPHGHCWLPEDGLLVSHEPVHCVPN